MTSKNCTKCGKELPLSSFSIDKRVKSGRRADCKNCQSFRKLKKSYNITQQEYDSLLSSQGGVCAICGSKPGKKKLAVDHDHSCCPSRVSCGSCIRGLLCQRCNFTLLGQVCRETSKGSEHAISVLVKAIKYLTPDTIVW